MTLRVGTTIYELNGRGVNLWSMDVMPGQTTRGERISEGRCEKLAREVHTAITYHQQLIKALQDCVKRIEGLSCDHPETYRGGTLWEVCKFCGEKWADDEGGKPEFEECREVKQAWKLLNDIFEEGV